MTKLNTLLHLPLFGLLVFPLTAARAQVAAQSCNSSDVQTAINQATEGQTVTIPPGNCTWTSGVTISGKGISVKGAGAGRIIAYSSDTLTIGTGSKNIDVTSALVNGSLSIANGQTLTVSETGNRQNYMVGTVSSYSSGTLTMNITSTGGSCGNSSSSQSPSNCKRWLISTIPSTVIVNNSTTTLFAVTEDSTYHTNLSGFKIKAGTGSGIGVQFTAGGGAAIILQNCWIEQNSTSTDAVNLGANRGVISNCSFDSTPFSMAPLAVHLQPYDLTSWSHTSYWGTADTTGQNNVYVETSDFHAYLNATDNDEGARSVFRYSLFNNAGFGTHGVDTGPIGQRYFEFYNNIGVYNGYNDLTTFPMNWWFFVRGGSYVIHDNTLPALVSTDYGTKSDVNMTVMNLQRNAGPAPCWGAGTSNGADYYAPHQVGLGYVTGKGTSILGGSTYSDASYGYGTQYVGDPEPAYIWNNSRAPLGNVGTSDYGGTECANPDSSPNYIKLNRDYYNGTTAKPGYTPYAYPHPLLGSASTAGPGVPIDLTSTGK
jgi:hypothetical protein